VKNSFHSEREKQMFELSIHKVGAHKAEAPAQNVKRRQQPDVIICA